MKEDSGQRGNTRVLFSSVTPAPTAYKATFEDNTITTEQSNFQNYPSGGNRSSLNLYDHTDAGTTYTKSQLLNAGYNSQIGLAKSFKVYPGDKVKIEAYGKYSNATGTTSNLTGFANALLAAYGVSPPAGGETGTVASALNTWGGIVAGGGDGENNSSPHAAVNIVIFDKDYKLLDFAYDQIDASGEQIGVSPVVAHNYMTSEYTIKEAGYAFLYIANENATQVDVYFDDVTMTLTKGNIIQSNEYYPFGLQTATSWTRDNSTGNNFLANSATELNSLTQLYDLDYRNYDPILGRMHQVDPLADNYGSWSPYKYGFNSPVNWNDPSGAADALGSAGGVGAFNQVDRYMDRMNSPSRMYGVVGDDDIYGSSFAKAGTVGYNYSGGYWVDSETTTTSGPNSRNSNSETKTSTSRFWVSVDDQDLPDITKLANNYLPAGLNGGLLSERTTWKWDMNHEYTGPTHKGAIATIEQQLESNPKANYTVWVDPRVGTTSYDKDDRYNVFGHEWQHLRDRRSGDLRKWANFYNIGIAKLISEFRAYNWNTNQIGGDTEENRREIIEIEYNPIIRRKKIDLKSFLDK